MLRAGAMNEPFRPEEAALRSKLGIPAEARRVLVFTESSHWDTNWLRTSEEYFEERLRPIFARVMAELEQDPARVYGIESVFFFKMYWERHPEHRARLRALVERRQLRVLASSLTTPDTLLPHEESLFRDFHLGQEWLRHEGFGVAPRTAYFPDNFGHSPHLPSLLHAVGVESVAVTRVDGMHFVAADYRPRGHFPLPGSTAELLQKDLRTLDFVWRADDGAEVLCHWNAFTYFHGDMLAHVGIVRWAGLDLAIPWRTRRHIARRIDGFVRELAPLARTPYLLCPIGMDFNEPIRDLRPLLARYNRERFPRTGTFTVLAGLDDYFDLVGFYREALPVLALDPNPYWMGFYASRPEVKQRPMRVARSLVLAEKLSAHAPYHAELEASLREAWQALVLLNHHDAITGTSPDRVWDAEQRLWIDIAERAAERALTLASADALAETSHVHLAETDELPREGGVRYWREGASLHVEAGPYALTFSEDRGGCLTSLVAHGAELLDGLGMDLVAYADEGGLWRLGHEYRGGGFTEVDRASRRHARVEAIERDAVLVVSAVAEVGGATFTRVVTCGADAPYVRLHVTGAAPRRRTITCRWETALSPAALEMDTVGGHIERPHERHYQPTFWPVPSFLSLRSPERSLHVSFEAPTAASFRATGALEWIVARNAPKERAFYGLLPVLAHPIGGTVDEVQTHDAALFVAEDEGAVAEVRRRVERAWLPAGHAHLEERAGALVLCDDPAVAIVAVKRADVGDGVIVRLGTDDLTPRTVRLWLAGSELARASRADVRERDLEDLAVESGAAEVPLRGRFTTVRLVRA